MFAGEQVVNIEAYDFNLDQAKTRIDLLHNGLSLSLDDCRTFEVQENPSTGFKWYVDEDTLKGVTVTSGSISAKKNGRGLVGAPSRKVWTICAEHNAVVGTVSTFHAKYFRAW